MAPKRTLSIHQFTFPPTINNLRILERTKLLPLECSSQRQGCGDRVRPRDILQRELVRRRRGCAVPGQARPAPNYSQPYISAVTTRGIIYIEAQSPNIGLMVIVFIGMAEVSSSEFTVEAGQDVTKGQLALHGVSAGGRHQIPEPPTLGSGQREELYCKECIGCSYLKQYYRSLLICQGVNIF